MSGCDRELNAHVYSAASQKHHVPDTWHDTTPSHIILTLGRPVLALPRKSECQAAASTIFNDWSDLGSNPWPPVPQSGAIGASRTNGQLQRDKHWFEKQMTANCWPKLSLYHSLPAMTAANTFRIRTGKYAYFFIHHGRIPSYISTGAIAW